MDGFMAVERIGATALGAESAVLAAVAAGLTAADLERPSPCPPWTVAGLLGHVIVATGRVGPAIEAGRNSDFHVERMAQTISRPRCTLYKSQVFSER